MSQITDLGVNFKFEGANDFESRLKAMESGWKSFSEAMDKTPQVNNHFAGMAGAANKASKSIVNAMNLAKAAIIGILAVRGVEGIANWMGTGGGVGKAQDYKRFTGATESEIEAVSKLGTKLNRTLAGFNKEKFEWGTYDIQSAHAKDSEAMRLRVMEDVGYLAKLFESGDYREASTFYKTMWSGFGQFLPEKEQAGFSGQVLSGLQTALSQTGATSNQIRAAMEQVAPMYSQMNYSWAKTMTDSAILSSALGSGEKAGTALRNLSSRGGESFGKLYEALAKTRYQGAKGQRYWEMKEEDQQRFDAGKKYDIERKTEAGAKLLRDDPIKYWLEVNKMINEIKKDKQADVAGILGAHGFGEESLTAAMVMAKVMGTGEYQRVLKVFQSMDPDKTRHGVESGQVSFASQWELFEQKVHEFQKTVRKTIEPFIKEIIEPYGNMFTRMSDAWSGSIKSGVMVDLKTAWDSFWDEFNRGVSGLPNIEQSFNNIIKALNTYSPQDWIELGREWGKWASTNFNSLIEGLKEVGSALSQIAKLAKTVNEYLGPDEAKQKLIKQAEKPVTPETPLEEHKKIVEAQTQLEKEGTGAGWFWPMLGGLKKGVWGALGGMAWEATTKGPYNPALHGDVPYESSYMTPEQAAGLKQSLGGPIAPGGFIASPNVTGGNGITVQSSPQVETKVEINVDDQKIKDAIKAEVKTEIKEEMHMDEGRNRANANDRGLF